MKLTKHVPRFAAIGLVSLLIGCSKKEAVEAPAAPAETPQAEAAPAAAEAAPAAAAAPAPTVRDWDKVVAEILQLRRGNISDDERMRMLSLQDELSDAAVHDPAAREARNNLLRIVNQR